MEARAATPYPTDDAWVAREGPQEQGPLRGQGRLECLTAPPVTFSVRLSGKTRRCHAPVTLVVQCSWHRTKGRQPLASLRCRPFFTAPVVAGDGRLARCWAKGCPDQCGRDAGPVEPATTSVGWDRGMGQLATLARTQHGVTASVRLTSMETVLAAPAQGDAPGGAARRVGAPGPLRS